jgi:hypothetical protein
LKIRVARRAALASLQVESLANFAVATAALPDGQLKGAHWEAARRSTDVLGRFYGAARPRAVDGTR